MSLFWAAFWSIAIAGYLAGILTVVILIGLVFIWAWRDTWHMPAKP